jgi:integrase
MAAFELSGLAAETYAYSLEEVRRILAVLEEPARTVVLTAALTGLRKGEISGLRWADFNGRELAVNRSLWLGLENDSKTERSQSPVPVVRELADALEDHGERLGKLATPSSAIFPSGGEFPLNLDNLARRTIQPAIEKCAICRKSEHDHPTEGHLFQLNKSLQWHGWHAFRRGLATNLHALGVDDKSIQGILRHSNISITQNDYIKSVPASRISAMDLLEAELRKESCTKLAPNQKVLPN